MITELKKLRSDMNELSKMKHRTYINSRNILNKISDNISTTRVNILNLHKLFTEEK